MPDSKEIRVLVSDTLDERVRAYCFTHRCTKTSLVRDSIEAYLNSRAPKKDKRKANVPKDQR